LDSARLVVGGDSPPAAQQFPAPAIEQKIRYFPLSAVQMAASARNLDDSTTSRRPRHQITRLGAEVFGSRTITNANLYRGFQAAQFAEPESRGDKKNEIDSDSYSFGFLV
jgi:hypothetical protein